MYDKEKGPGYKSTFLESEDYELSCSRWFNGTLSLSEIEYLVDKYPNEDVVCLLCGPEGPFIRDQLEHK